jgi:hypothetical protein
LGNAPQSEVTVNLSYSGVAADGTDFTGVHQVTFDTLSTTFTIPTIIDAAGIEGPESFTITIVDDVSGGNFESIVPHGTDYSVETTIYEPFDTTSSVEESDMDLDATGDLAASTSTGSTPDDTGETATDSLNLQNGWTAVDATGTTAYGSYSIDSSTGTFTYTLVNNAIHDAPPSTDPVTDTITYTATKDGVTITNTLNINIVDDVPVAITPDNVYAEDDTTIPGTAIEQLNFNAGADGVGTVVFTGITGQLAQDGNSNTLMYEGQNLYLHYGSGGTDQTLLEATTSSTLGEGIIAFYIDIDPEAGTYEFHSNGMITNGTETNATDLSGVGGGNVTWKALLDINGTEQDVMMSTATGETVNTSASEIGISSGNSFEAGEGIRFDFVNNLTADKVGNTWEFDYDGTHNDQVAFRQVIDKASGLVNIELQAIKADDDDFFYNDSAIPDPPDETLEPRVSLSADEITIYNDLGEDVTDQVSFSGGGDSITIGGLEQGWTFEIDTSELVDGAFSAVQIDAAPDTVAFKLGSFSYGVDAFGEPIELEYQIQGIDGDGDTTDGAIHATIFPNGGVQVGTTGDDDMTGGPDADTLIGDGGQDGLSGLAGDDILSGGRNIDSLDGGEGNDMLDGGSGDDTLIGGSGADTLIGGSGADTFKVADGDDTIKDYNFADGDVVDISDVFEDGVDSLEVTSIDGDVTISILDGNSDPKGSVTVEGDFDDFTSIDELVGVIDVDDGSDA